MGVYEIMIKLGIMCLFFWYGISTADRLPRVWARADRDGYWPDPMAPVASPAVFDVTDYGAVGDNITDDTVAFIAAWEDACNYAGRATFLVPNGTYYVGPLSFSGPCYNNRAPSVEIQGTLRAPSSLKAFTKPYWLSFQHLRRLTVNGSGIALLDGQGHEAWLQKHKSVLLWAKKTIRSIFPRSLMFENVTDGYISGMNLVDSKGFHVVVSNSRDIVIEGFNIVAPWNSPNTDGIHIGESTNIMITSSIIGVGDDCVSIGPGSFNISISHIKCGPGHGISIGSLGKRKNEKDVVTINVRNCTINGTSNGVRIKTWPGSEISKASHITFEGITMTNVTNPIIINQEYCDPDCPNLTPSQVQVSNIVFKNISGTSRTMPVVTLHCSLSVPCENLTLHDINLIPINLSTPTSNNPKPWWTFRGSLRGLNITNFSQLFSSV